MRICTLPSLLLTVSIFALNLKSAQSCLTVTPWTIAHQAPLSRVSWPRILEWVAISFTTGSSHPEDWTWVSSTAGRCFTIWATTKPNCFKAMLKQGFPGSSAGKKSTCNAGSIPGLGRSPGEGIGYPLQYSWASLVAETVKNPPAMWETWVWSLDWEDPLEAGMVTQSSILAWRIRMDRGAWWATVHGVAKSWTRLSD